MLQDKNADKQQPLLGRNLPCFVQMLLISVGSQKNSVNWEDIDLAKTVEVQAGFRLGDEPDKLTVCLMMPKVGDGGNIFLGCGE